jgi:hypothetical protein
MRSLSSLYTAGQTLTQIGLKNRGNVNATLIVSVTRYTKLVGAEAAKSKSIRVHLQRGDEGRKRSASGRGAFCASVTLSKSGAEGVDLDFAIRLHRAAFGGDHSKCGYVRFDY